MLASETSSSCRGLDRGRGVVFVSLSPALSKCFPLPRLETRTKESNMCASAGVIETRARNESESGGRAVTGPHHPPTSILRETAV